MTTKLIFLIVSLTAFPSFANECKKAFPPRLGEKPPSARAAEKSEPSIFESISSLKNFELSSKDRANVRSALENVMEAQPELIPEAIDGLEAMLFSARAPLFAKAEAILALRGMAFRQPSAFLTIAWILRRAAFDQKESNFIRLRALQALNHRVFNRSEELSLDLMRNLRRLVLNKHELEALRELSIENIKELAFSQPAAAPEAIQILNKLVFKGKIAHWAEEALSSSVFKAENPKIETAAVEALGALSIYYPDMSWKMFNKLKELSAKTKAPAVKSAIKRILGELRSHLLFQKLTQRAHQTKANAQE